MWSLDFIKKKVNKKNKNDLLGQFSKLKHRAHDCILFVFPKILIEAGNIIKKGREKASIQHAAQPLSHQIHEIFYKAWNEQQSLQ